METRCFSFSRNCSTHGTTNSGFACIQTLPPTSTIYCMETRSGQYSNRSIPAFMGQGVLFRFSAIPFDKSCSEQDPQRKDRTSNHSDTHMVNSTLLCTILKMSIQPSSLLPQVKNVLTNPQGKKYPQVETRSLRLAVWKVPGKVCKWKEFQAMLPSLSHIQGEKAQQLNTNQPGVSGIGDVIIDKLILFKYL